MRGAALALVAALTACGPDERAAPIEAPVTGGAGEPERPLRAAILVEDGTSGGELTASLDVFRHTPFHARPGVEVVTVARSLSKIRTFEGLVVQPDHDYGSAPPLDILVVPGAPGRASDTADDPALLEFVRARAPRARFVMSLRDGAFVLGHAGLLDGRSCTTDPGDVTTLRERFPAARVVDGVSFVVDGGLITAAGGARSFEPALWLVERLFGETPARGVARGLVVDWHLDAVPHLDVGAAVAGAIGHAAGDRIDPSTSVLDAAGVTHRILDLASPEDRVLVLFLFGGGDWKGEARRGGLWCEDSLNELPLLRHLLHRFAGEGVAFVPVALPPVFHEERFGHRDGAFEGEGDAAEIARFVEATERARGTGVIPFERLYYDPTFRLSRDVRLLAAEPGAPAWVGRFRPRDEWQTYGTPCVWILSRDGVVLTPPFHGNHYEREGVLRYTARELGVALERALSATAPPAEETK